MSFFSRHPLLSIQEANSIRESFFFFCFSVSLPAYPASSIVSNFGIRSAYDVAAMQTGLFQHDLGHGFHYSISQTLISHLLHFPAGDFVWLGTEGRHQLLLLLASFPPRKIGSIFLKKGLFFGRTILSLSLSLSLFPLPLSLMRVRNISGPE